MLYFKQVLKKGNKVGSFYHIFYTWEWNVLFSDLFEE